MAQSYTHDDITLKVESMGRRNHYFFDDKGNIIGDLLVNRTNNIIFLNFHNNIADENSIDGIVKCYNEFIAKNKKLKSFSFDINKNENNFDIYGIKKDLDSPTILVTKKQIDELDKNKVPYYKYYTQNLDPIDKDADKNKNIAFSGEGRFNIDSPDKLENCIFYADNTTDNTHIMLNFNYDKKILENNQSIKMPKINLFGSNDIIVKKDASLHVGADSIEMPPVDFSNVSHTFNNIFFRSGLSKENLLKTLETIDESTQIMINDLDIPSDAVERGRRGSFYTYNRNELADYLKNELQVSQNSISNDIKE